MSNRIFGRLSGGALAVLVALSVTGAAEAATARVATVPFTGPRASLSRDQIVSSICDRVTCVPQAQVTRRGRPDWAKVRRAKVDLVITGAVSGPANKRVLTVQVMDERGRRKFSERYTLARNGLLSRSALEQLQERILALAQPAASADEEEKAPDPRAERTREADREEPPAGPREDDSGRTRYTDDEERRDRRRGADDDRRRGDDVREDARVEAAPERDEQDPSARPLIVAEAGADFIHRNFSYSNLRVPNLRSYETRPVLFAPRLHLEAYPLARSMEGVVKGLGLELDFLYALGLRSIDENGVAHPTTVTRLDLAARLNLWPLEDRPLTVAPILGYRSARFVVGKGPDGSELAGLPDIAYGSLRVGGEAEYGVGPGVVFGRLEYVHVLSLGEIGSEAFFPESSGNAVEFQLGGGYRAVKNLDVRVSLHYTRYGLSFRPAEGATYQASGAVDQYVGGAVTARYTYY